MHPHNRYYGQNQVLAVYVGDIDRFSPPSIPGHLQHDWDLVHDCSDATRLGPGRTAYLWSGAAARRRSARGGSGQVVIGAPWLYLLELDLEEMPRPAPDPEDDPTAAEVTVAPAGTLWLPRHDLRGEHAARRLAAEIVERETGPVTVALSHRDHAVPQLRQAYLDTGLSVVTLGEREDEGGTDDPRYLLRLLELMRAHRSVASNTLDALVLYAAAAGLSAQVYGDAPDGPSAAHRDEAAVRGSSTSATLNDIADRELGRRHLMPSAELSAVLEWSPRA
ncbi:hypothetical protein [Luteipulveratus flavus]|uniref:Uncharacterized protein n=1 Tax=Luteipulveratus flavus TaxID=3031728 RepID=A0ABT6C238_9MICO|nr:hypothetical protein [Luteipulveratus sp. YIM 133296]MDF8262964.1 hypothetical protein [Luteipulveratus sp. YIM 133296]